MNTTHPKLERILEIGAGLQNLATYCGFGAEWEKMMAAKSFWESCTAYWAARHQGYPELASLATIFGDAFLTVNSIVVGDIDKILQEDLEEIEEILNKDLEFFGQLGDSLEEIKQRLSVPA